MTEAEITYYPGVEQGSDEWHALRCGMLTASEMKLIITPTLKSAKNVKERTHLFELLAQRITKHVEPSYISDDMLRGINDENEACALYSKHYAEVTPTGFVINRSLGFPIGYSPDGLIGDDGLIEIKSRRAKFQAETILNREMPSDYLIQAQTGLWVTQRKWLDFVSFCGGMPMMTIRVYPDLEVQSAILTAAVEFERILADRMNDYASALLRDDLRLIPTERKIEQEMHV